METVIVFSGGIDQDRSCCSADPEQIADVLYIGNVGCGGTMELWFTG